MAISKLTLIGGSAGLISAIAGGVAIYLNSGESIRDHIAKKKGSNFKFISLVSEAEVALKTRYGKGKNNKPKKDKKEIGEDEIITWCKDFEKTKFSNETDPVYLSMSDWCFVDVTSLSEKANRDSNRLYVSNEEGGAEAWKTAWDAYIKGKTNNTLRINDSTLSNLNGGNKDGGAIDLQKWCKKTGSKKMYEADSETIYQTYEKWCFRDK